MRLAVEISVVVDGKRQLLGSIPIEFQLRDLRPWRRLSERQQEVVDLVMVGKSNKEIAAQLFIAERTVKFHVSDLMRRHGVSSRIALIAVRQKQICSGGQDT
ncbi:MAG TPA: helix-turn-helix transcriptional regulator [Candidatus Acidoferrum sp.]|jgi:DNA-binding NarL/FixJ family response regulator